MKPLRCFPTSLQPILGATVALLLCTAQLALAEDEIRAGAVLQIPITFSSLQSPVDISAIRIGLTCQFVEVERDKFLTENFIWEETIINSITHKDGGNRVYGVEGNVFLEIFDEWNASAELLGLYGGNSVQGAIGVGYDLRDEFFIDAKAMFPYSEIGMRFLGPFEIYGGVKTLGTFDPKNKVYPDRDIQLIEDPNVE